LYFLMKKTARTPLLSLARRWMREKTAAGDYLFRSEDGWRLARGDALRLVIPLIDGRRTANDIVRQLTGLAPIVDIHRAIDWLKKGGLLSTAETAETREDVFWQLADADPSQVADRRARASVEIFAANRDHGEQVAQALGALGVQTRPGSPFRIVITDDYLDERLTEHNRAVLHERTAWLLVRPFGRRQWIGPLLVPGRTACWHCLAARLKANGWSQAASLAFLPTAAASTLITAATEAAKWLLTGRNAAIEGSIQCIDTGSLEINAHPVIRFPQCPVCRPNKSLTKVRNPGRTATIGSGFVASAQSVAAFLAEHVSDITGIVSEPEFLPNDYGLSVCLAAGSQIWRPDGSGSLMLSNQMIAGGAGRTETEAKACCLAEAIERYSVQWHGDAKTVKATMADLGDAAISPQSLMLFSEAQYAARQSWNKQHPGSNYVPERFDAAAITDWVKIEPLTPGSVRYVPAGYCYLGYRAPWCNADTNGGAAGSTRDEALLHAFLELVERDAAALWWYNRARRPAIPLEAFGSPRLLDLAQTLERSGRSLHLLDITTDLAIPAYAAVTTREDGRMRMIGTAAGLDPEIAGWRAALSAAKNLVILQNISKPRSRWRSLAETGLVRWHTGPATKEHAYLDPIRAQSKPPSSLRSLSTGDAAKDLALCVRLAKRCGVEVYCLDMTRLETRFPVARAIAPGLRPWRARFAAGRLYEVPVSLGWVRKPVAEAGLNPVPIYL
jgi:ribosomal protein S12 methylthiotransferase accessory factor